MEDMSKNISTSVHPSGRRVARRIAAGAFTVLATAGVASPLQASAEPEVAAASDAAATETHIFTGSSTSVAAFEAWFNGSEFVKPEIETRDLRTLVLPNGQEAEAGAEISKIGDEFIIKV